jgi:hypothetical protein
MFQFKCEWADGPRTSTRSGFDLGHMTFVSEKGICSSRGRTPDQAMMLAIAIVELLDGLRRFLLERRSEYTFVGADSSFSVRFRKAKGERIAIQCGASPLGEVDATTLCRAVLSGAETFFQQPENKLPQSDPALEDLTSALEAFARAFR